MTDEKIKLAAPAQQPEELPNVHDAPYPWMRGKDGLLSCSPRQIPRGLRRAYAIHRARAEKGGK